MSKSKSKSRSNSKQYRHLKLGLIASILASISSALAAPTLIPKPAPLDNYGMEAASSVAITRDFVVMGAYKTRESHNDSPGGVYLFQNANTNPTQFLEPAPNVAVKVYDFDRTNGKPTLRSGPPRLCATHTLGAQAGYRVAASERWVALTSGQLGRWVSADTPAAECGVTPAVFLARRTSAGEAKPFGALQYLVSAPFKEWIFGVAVSDTALALKTDTGVFFYTWDGYDWVFNNAVAAPSQMSQAQVAALSTDGERFVLGNPAQGSVTVFTKQQGLWSAQAVLNGDKTRSFGVDVDLDRDRLIVGGSNFVAFYKLDTLGRATLLNEDTTYAGTHVAISGDNAVASSGKIDRNQETKFYRFVNYSQLYEGIGSLSGVLDLPAVSAANQQFNAEEVDISGLTMVAGWRSYNAPSGNSLVGAAITSSVGNAFNTRAFIEDNGEKERSWVNTGKFDWSRRTGASATENTGPLAGVGGSAYYSVDTSFGYANAAGDEASLETDLFDATDRLLSFDYNMYGQQVGTLRAEVLVNNTWQEIWRKDGQNAGGTRDWQHSPSLALNAYATSGKVKLRLRYTAKGGPRGDVALDNLYIVGPHVCAPRCNNSAPVPPLDCFCDSACEAYSDCCSPSAKEKGREFFAGVNDVCAYVH